MILCVMFIPQNGLLSSIPFLARWITSFVASILADQLVKKRTMSVTNTRKIYVIIGKRLLCWMLHRDRGRTAFRLILNVHTRFCLHIVIENCCYGISKKKQKMYPFPSFVQNFFCVNCKVRIAYRVYYFAI